MRNYKNERLGLKAFNNEGLEMQIIGYRDSSDIDVKFLEYDVIYKRRTFREFIHGHIKYKGEDGKSLCELRVGEVRTNNKGLEMEIVAYRNYHSIDVKFLKSGYIAERRSYYDFSRGLIKDRSIFGQRLWQIRKNKRGLRMQIIGYKTSNDIEVQFLDSGYIAKHRSYYDFCRGGITDRSKEKRKNYNGFFSGREIYVAEVSQA